MSISLSRLLGRPALRERPSRLLCTVFASGTPRTGFSICPACQFTARVAVRNASLSGHSSYLKRQSKDRYVRDAKVRDLKSRAAFKLLQMHNKYNLFKRGQTVVDLGYAPGSWSQVAIELTRPNGRIVGIDLIPAQPPKGMTTIQGNFLSPHVQALLKSTLREQQLKADKERRLQGKLAKEQQKLRQQQEQEQEQGPDESEESAPPTSVKTADEAREGKADSEGDVLEQRPSYIDLQKQDSQAIGTAEEGDSRRMVDVVLSDMSEPWPQISGFYRNTLSNPCRLMNTSGINFMDHANSMDLCAAALEFASDTLRAGGHFVCKFYPGSEDKAFEGKLKKMFGKVHREKPEASRAESKECYFVALRRKRHVTLQDIEETAASHGPSKTDDSPAESS